VQVRGWRPPRAPVGEALLAKARAGQFDANPDLLKRYDGSLERYAAAQVPQVAVARSGEKRSQNSAMWGRDVESCPHWRQIGVGMIFSFCHAGPARTWQRIKLLPTPIHRKRRARTVYCSTAFSSSAISMCS